MKAEDTDSHKPGLYQPREGEAMNVIVFGSGSGTNLLALLKGQEYLQRETGGEGLYKIKGIFCDRKCKCMDIGRNSGIPILYRSFEKFFEGKDKKDPEMRNAYDQKIVRIIDNLSDYHGFPADLIALAGYRRVIFSPLLRSFKDRMINIHPADLAIADGSGKRTYTGDKAVREVIKGGEEYTRSTAHLVTEAVDGGEILTRSCRLEVPRIREGYTEKDLKKLAGTLQDEQKRCCDWPTYIYTVAMIAQGRIGINEKRNICVDGIETENGCDLEEKLQKSGREDLASKAARHIQTEGI